MRREAKAVSACSTLNSSPCSRTCATIWPANWSALLTSSSRTFPWYSRQPSILSTRRKLLNIQGVGAGKAKRYGQPFCDLIKKYCEENDIVRPEEYRVKTVAKKSMQKVKIIQSIDHQLSLDDIARAEGLDFDELIDKLDDIVDSGTKLNIDYYLDDTYDEDQIDDIYDYFMESDTDDIDKAMDELNEDYTEEEIRLVRIQFISEMAN